jgi:hypothetical protein
MMVESIFLNTYGSPLLQAAVGMRAEPYAQRRRIARDLSREVAAQRRAAELEAKVNTGGMPEAMLRALMYIRGREGKVDERAFRAFEGIRSAQPESERLPLARLKSLVRDQTQLMELDEERALAAIPKLLPDDSRRRQDAKVALMRILTAGGELSDTAKQRLARVEALFGVAGQRRKGADLVLLES